MNKRKQINKAIKARLLQKWTSYNHRLHILNLFAIIPTKNNFKII